MYPETSGAMTRSFSLAPGGWVGTKPGRAGETKEQDSASERKRRAECSAMEVKSLMGHVQQLSIQQDHALSLGEIVTQSINKWAINGRDVFGIKHETNIINGLGSLKQGGREFKTMFGPQENSIKTRGSSFGSDLSTLLNSSSEDTPERKHRQLSQSELVSTEYSQYGAHQQVQGRNNAVNIWYNPYIYPYGPAIDNNSASHNDNVPYFMGQNTAKLMAPIPMIGHANVVKALEDQVVVAQATFSYTFHNQVTHGGNAFVNNNIVPYQHPNLALSRPVSIHDSFKPSRALTNAPRAVSPNLIQRAQQIGVRLNANYKGDITEDLITNSLAAKDDNCALHIINIPAGATLSELLSVISEGKIFSSSMIAPIPGQWKGCAAKVVFTTRAAAQEFKDRGKKVGIWIRGERVNVFWNRNITRPQLYSDKHQSRVIQIRGPQDQLSVAQMHAFFAEKIKFELLDQKEWLVLGGMKVVELTFPSIFGQSRAAVAQFMKTVKGTPFEDIFLIQYGKDPCDPASRMVEWWEGRRF